MSINQKQIRGDYTAGITASVTQSQGQQPLTTRINEVSVCANASDVVTLPVSSTLLGKSLSVINNGAQTLQIFPASGGDLGAGSNNSMSLPSGSGATFSAYSATNWRLS